MSQSVPTQNSPMEPNGREIGLQELWGTLWRSRWTVIGVTAATVALTGAITVLMPPVYESEAVVQVRSDEAGGGLLSSLSSLGDLGDLSDLGLPSLGKDQVDTEMGILRSRRITGAVADSLGLNVDVTRPKGRRDVLQVLGTGRDTLEGKYVLRRTDDGVYALSARKKPKGLRIPDRVAIGDTFQIGGVVLALQPASATDLPEEIRFEVHSFQQMLTDLRDDLKVDRQTGGSQLMEITYRHSDPRVAAGVVNGIVGNYLVFKRRTSLGDSRSTIEELEHQVASYQRDLDLAEARLQDFQERERIVAPEEQATQQVKRVAEVQAGLDAMMVEREALGNVLMQVEERSRHPGVKSPYRQLATFPSFIANKAIQDVLAALIELENDRAELLQLRTEQSADVRLVEQRISELEGQLFRLGANYLESLDTQIASANNAMARFGLELRAVPAKELEYARLTRDQKLLSELYVLLQARLKEAKVQEAIHPEAVRVIDYGMVADEPVLPKPLINLVLATIVGLMLGTVTAVTREMTSTKIRTRADAEGATAGLPVLGVIPPASTPAGTGTATATRRMIRIPRLAIGASSELSRDDALVTRRDPWSPVAEAYRGLATRLSLVNPERAPQVLVLTSALAEDGKSTVAANLAITLAQRGARTLLVDANLPDGALHLLFDVPSRPGLTDVLVGGAPLESALVRVAPDVAGAPLDLLATGERPAHPGDLLASERLARLLGQLRERYDCVVLDAPPLRRVADAELLGSLADTTLLVARNRVTERAALEDAATVLLRAGVHVGGIVLNDGGKIDPAPGRVAVAGPAANGHRRT